MRIARGLYVASALLGAFLAAHLALGWIDPPPAPSPATTAERTDRARAQVELPAPPPPPGHRPSAILPPGGRGMALYESDRDWSEVKAFYRRHFTGEGWQRLPEHAAALRTATGWPHAVAYAGERGRCEILAEPLDRGGLAVAVRMLRAEGLRPRTAGEDGPAPTQGETR